MLFFRTLAILTAIQFGLDAQTVRGSIVGSVTDASGSPVAGVPVKATEIDTGKRRGATADSQGQFTIGQLAPGSYRIEVEREGFRKHVQLLTLQVNQELRLAIALAPGSRSEAVEVTASRELLRTETAAMGAVIETRQILGLPLDGRNFFELSLLSPGAVPAAQGSAGSVRGDFAMHLNGSREDGNLFLLDGVYNGDPKLNGFAVNPPVDGIREFEVLASTYDASFGRNAGSQVNVVLKSGTNAIHGTAYHFFRNASLDARNYFAPAGEPKPAYQRNQFGFSLGGPVVRNRTFFFMDYEGRRVREGFTRLTRVPTLAERNGDFSSSARPPLNPFTQQPFPGNQIPAAFQHPIGRAIANLYPLPNRSDPVQNFVSSPAQRERSDQFDVRLDHALRNSDLSFRYSFTDRDLYEPFAGPSFSQVPDFGNNVPRRAQNVMLSETRAFRPTLLNEVRLGFNRVANGVFPELNSNNINRAVGLPDLSSNARDLGLSFLTITGFSPLGHEFNNPQQGVTNTYQIIDQLTWTSGRHLLKFGGDIRKLEQNAYRDVQSRGFLQFLGFITGNPMSDLLLGVPTVTGGATLDNPQHLRSESYNLFLNDTVRLKPNLTLSLGMRYEFNSAPVDPLDRANVFDSATGGLLQVGTGGVPRSGYFSDRNNFAPRIGLAWTPANSGFVIRTGYGFYYDQSALAPSEGLYFNAPYFNLRLFFFRPDFPLAVQNPFPANYPVPIPASAFSFQRDLKTPYVQQWNVSVQRHLGRSRVLEVGYVGSKGTHLLSARDVNQPRPSAAEFNLRPLPQYDDITQLESRANSNYHSLQIRFQQRMSAGLSMLSAYTYGKSIDDASAFFPSAGDPNFPQDSHNTRLERARSNFDIRQRFSAGYSYDLPFGKGKLRGGWQTHGILTLQTGRPFTVALLPEFDNSNTGRSNLGFGANDRPDVLSNPALSGRTAERWFDTRAFAPSPRGTFGNAGRNILDGPGLASLNFSLLKNVAFAERATLQFRFETFNLLDRVNFDLPDIFLGSPSFGRIQSAQNARRIQFGLKLLF
ncbi:MAG: carboxypeptidase regulatory-like domain-containing protein [Bryobacteraceae bacterium]|nr:carboxypeptidase regulatory-like domain-containing protein [Bryobacteraceae bacterium]